MSNNYIRLSSEQLDKLQSEMLILLKEVDKICRRYDIKYFLSYGTLIGAIRHNGFIPWDDDMDIEMFREDYDRFFDVCKKELDPEKFFLQRQETDSNYNWVFGKLRLNNTSYIRAGQEHLKQKDGIFIDIFPLDRISENKFKQKLYTSVCKVCRRVLWAPVGQKTVQSPLLRLFYKSLTFIPNNLVKSIFNFFAKIDNKKETKYLVSHNYLSGYIFKREWFDNPLNIDFEDGKFLVPSGFDDILTYIYGKYMILPPPEMRIGNSHASYIKFLDGTEVKTEE